MNGSRKGVFGAYAVSPSVIQYLGTQGTNSRPSQTFDFAEDF